MTIVTIIIGKVPNAEKKGQELLNLNRNSTRKGWKIDQRRIARSPSTTTRVRSPTISRCSSRSVFFIFKKFNGRRGGGGVCVSTGQVVGAQRKKSVSGGGHQYALTVVVGRVRCSAAAAAWAQMVDKNGGGGGAPRTICRAPCRHDSRSSARTSVPMNGGGTPRTKSRFALFRRRRFDNPWLAPARPAAARDYKLLLL